MSITDYAAIYAAIVATSALVWNILREQRKVKVRLALNWQPTSPNDEIGEIVQIGFIVINNSRYPVYIESVGVVFTNGGNYSWDHSTFVVDRCVRPGMKETYWKDYEDFKKYHNGETIKFGYVEDATLKVYKARMPKKLVKEIILEGKILKH